MAFETLSALETELIALKDVVAIIKSLPIEKPAPPYLVRRIFAHTDLLNDRFRDAWDALI